MERKIQKLLVVTGLFMGAAVALSPLTTYAAYDKSTFDASMQQQKDFYSAETNTNGSTVVNVDVDTVLSLDAANGGYTIQAFPDMISKGEFNVQVRSAVPYTISLSADDTNLSDSSESFFIPASDKVTAGKVGWGIRAADQEEGYTAVSTTPKVFFDSGTGVADESTWTKFEVGVAVNSKVPQGIYTTDVTVTAAVKQ